jgi:hypothetical protein
MRVELVTGTRRRRHVEGVLVGDVLRVAYPPRMSRVEAERIAEELRVRMERRVASDRLDLAARARALARRFELPRPVRVEWSDRQLSRWGSCDPADGVIRVSRRLAAFPVWVLDYVLVHELAHLVEPDHGPRFQALVARYPRAERAVGFLIAKDLAPDGADGGDDADLADDGEHSGGHSDRPDGPAAPDRAGARRDGRSSGNGNGVPRLPGI